MANRRMISKGISTSRKVNRLPDRAALLYTWMIPHTDDYGRLEGDTFSIKAKIAPMRKITEEQIREDLNLMEEKDLIRQYKVKDEQYLEIIGFNDHQTFRPDRPRRSLYPNPQGKLSSGKSTSYQRHTNDIPVDDIDQRKRSNKLSNKLRERRNLSKPENSMKYLSKIPKKDIKEWMLRFVVTEDEIIEKGEALKLWCETNGRFKKNYRSFLLNAIKKDFAERKKKTGKYSDI